MKSFTVAVYRRVGYYCPKSQLFNTAGMPRLTRSSAKLASSVKDAAPPSEAPTPAPKRVNPPVVTAVKVPESPNDFLYFPDASAFESWLETNHASPTSGVWLRISKKASSTPSVTYDEAVDAALCYGWIDGQRKSHDDSSFIQRFTPRRKGSIWSKRNVEKIATLTASGRMRPAGQAEADAAQADGRWERAYAGSRTIEVTPEFQAALDENMEARRFFETLSKSQRYPFLHRIATAKKAETKERKIRQFVELLAQGKTL